MANQEQWDEIDQQLAAAAAGDAVVGGKIELTDGQISLV